MQRILITGGAGFIGSNLSEHFLHKGYAVRCLDNFSTGFRKNIIPFLNYPNYELLEGDIRNLEDCKEAVKDIDFVLHQAALGSVPRSIKEPQTTNDVNILGFLNMLIASRNAKVKRFIYAASSSVYGDSESLPKIEDHIGRPLSPYAVTKYVNELYADVFSRIYGLETIGLRYFNVFGPKQDPHGNYAAIIPLFIKKLIAHESPVINGDGNHSRDFTYIDNIIQMNEKAMLVKEANTLNTIYNVAVGEQTSLNELVVLLKDLLKKYDPDIEQVKIIYGPERAGDIPHSLASVEKAQKYLDYKPTHNIYQGLKESIDWYWKNLR